MLGVFELLVIKAHHNTIASLVMRIKEVMGNFDTDTAWRRPAAVSGPGLKWRWRQTVFFLIEWYIMPITFIFCFVSLKSDYF
jgi:hypothetical protein